MTRHNKEWSVPLLLTDLGGNDGLNAKVREINSHLRQGVTLEYREDGASNSTFFDVETATLEPDYKYQRNRQGTGKFVLKVWTRPLGHTGTNRIVATALGTQGFAQFPVASMGLAGDSLAKLSLSAAGASPNKFTGLIWGVAGASRMAVHSAGSGLIPPTGSQYAPATNSIIPTAIKKQPTNSQTLFVGASSGNPAPTALRGQTVRVLLSYQPWAIASSDANIGFARWLLYGLESGAGATGPAIAIPGFSGSSAYRTLDLGQCQIPSSGAAQLRIYSEPTNTVASYILASTLWHVESADAFPIGGLGIYLDTSASANNVVSATVGWDAPMAQSASYSIADEVRMIGDLPRIESDELASAFLYLRTISPYGETGRSRAFTVGAREQFQFFR